MEGIIETMSRWKRANEKLRQELRTLKTENTLMGRLLDDFQERSKHVRALEAESADLDHEIRKVQEELALLDSTPALDDTLETDVSFQAEVCGLQLKAFQRRFRMHRSIRC